MLYFGQRFNFRTPGWAWIVMLISFFWCVFIWLHSHTIKTPEKFQTLFLGKPFTPRGKMICLCYDTNCFVTFGEESLFNLNCKSLYFHGFHLTFIHLYSNSDNLNSPPTRSKFPFPALIKVALKFYPDNSNSGSCYPTLTPSC